MPATPVPSATMQAPVRVAKIDHVVRLLLSGEGQRIGKDQAPLGVGVQNLDGFAIQIANDIARLLRVVAGQIIGCRDIAGDFDIEAEDKANNSWCR